MKTNYMQSHGQQILRDYRRNKFLGKVKSLLSKLLSKVLIGSSVGSFLVAGFFAGDALAGFHFIIG